MVVRADEVQKSSGNFVTAGPGADTRQVVKTFQQAQIAQANEILGGTAREIIKSAGLRGIRVRNQEVISKLLAPVAAGLKQKGVSGEEERKQLNAAADQIRKLALDAGTSSDRTARTEASIKLNNLVAGVYIRREETAKRVG